METRLAIPRRSKLVGDWKEGGNPVAAVFPIHYPRALLRAFRFLPVEVWGPPGVGVGYGAMHLQPYVCSVARNILSFLQAGGLDVADVLIVPHACDTLQGLGSILIDLVAPRQPVIPIYLPRGRRQSDVDFLADEFRSIYRQLEAVTGRSPSDAELWEQIQRDEAADKLFSQLYRRRPNLSLSDSDFYRLLRSREYLPAETFMELAQSALAGDAPQERGRDTIPLILSGIVPEPMDLFEALSTLGGRVVADDLACCGRRLYPAGKCQELFHRMAERIIYAPPDPSRANPIQERLAHLLQLAGSFEARGVIFYEVKFCEPELFDLPDLRQGLQEANIPSLTIEMDLNDPVSHRLLTRLEAFLEMLR